MTFLHRCREQSKKLIINSKSFEQDHITQNNKLIQTQVIKTGTKFTTQRS